MSPDMGGGSRSLEDLLGGWDGRAVFTVHDADADAWIFIALDSDRLGPSAGGTRIKQYDQPGDGLLDAFRLSRGMTHKWAVLGANMGGGKAVIALSRPLSDAEREALLSRYAGLLKKLEGSFLTAGDLGTSVDDLIFLGRQAPNSIAGYEADTDTIANSGKFTAYGVLFAIRAAVGHVFGDPSLAGKRVLVQGVGSVGGPLAALLAEGGAQVMIQDVDDTRAFALADEVEGIVAKGDPAEVDCDVYAPCAVGGVLTDEVAGRIRARIVAGAANNQLSHPGVADVLASRGVLYAPDYLVNAGGALGLAMTTAGRSWDEIEAALERMIGHVLTDVLKEAEERGETPSAACGRRVERTLEAGPSEDAAVFVRTGS